MPLQAFLFPNISGLLDRCGWITADNKDAEDYLQNKICVQRGDDIVEHYTESACQPLHSSCRRRFQYIKDPEKKESQYDREHTEWDAEERQEHAGRLIDDYHARVFPLVYLLRFSGEQDA